MAGVRRGAVAVLRYYVPLFIVAVIVQIFLAGEGIFGIKGGPELDDQKTVAVTYTYEDFMDGENGENGGDNSGAFQG